MRIFAVGTKIFGGPGQHFRGPVPPGPNVEPPLGTSEDGRVGDNLGYVGRHCVYTPHWRGVDAPVYNGGVVQATMFAYLTY